MAAIFAKAVFWQKHLHETFNERQIKMLNRYLDGFERKLTSTKWAKITKTSQDSANRDISDLAERDFLIKEGSGRSTHYLVK